MTQPLRIYVGWDSREEPVYEVCKHSLHRYNNSAEVIPLKLNEMRRSGIVWRENDAKASTEFTFTRFFVPYLNRYQGWALFVDCDFLFLTDIQKLFNLADEKYAVMVVQHDYTPKETTKMNGKEQTTYPRKNWSSAMLFNCAHPKNALLNLQTLNNAEMKFLHRFEWLDDSEIGNLPVEWNWLEGWYSEPLDGKPSAVHYTRGAPYFFDYFACEYSKEWKDEYKLLTGNEFTIDQTIKK